jgi:hypothetical protein
MVMSMPAIDFRKLGAEMALVPGGGVPMLSLLGSRLADANHVGERLLRRRRMRHQYDRRRGDQPDRREILQRLIARVGVEVRD